MMGRAAALPTQLGMSHRSSVGGGGAGVQRTRSLDLGGVATAGVPGGQRPLASTQLQQQLGLLPSNTASLGGQQLQLQQQFGLLPSNTASLGGQQLLGSWWAAAVGGQQQQQPPQFQTMPRSGTSYSTLQRAQSGGDLQPAAPSAHSMAATHLLGKKAVSPVSVSEPARAVCPSCRPSSGRGGVHRSLCIWGLHFHQPCVSYAQRPA
jgi:hypothetical protein